MYVARRYYHKRDWGKIFKRYHSEASISKENIKTLYESNTNINEKINNIKNKLDENSKDFKVKQKDLDKELKKIKKQELKELEEQELILKELKELSELKAQELKELQKELCHPIVITGDEVRGDKTAIQYTNLTSQSHVEIGGEIIETRKVPGYENQNVVPIIKEKIIFTRDSNLIEKNWDKYPLIKGDGEAIGKIVVNMIPTFAKEPKTLKLITEFQYTGLKENGKSDINDITDITNLKD